MTIEFTKTAAIEAAITDALDAEMATRWVVVAETVDSNGEVSLASLCSPDLPVWVRSGMLRWEADTLAGQPLWTDAVGEGRAPRLGAYALGQRPSPTAAHANNTAANRQPTWSETKPNATAGHAPSQHGLLNTVGPAQAGSDQHTPAAT